MRRYVVYLTTDDVASECTRNECRMVRMHTGWRVSTRPIIILTSELLYSVNRRGLLPETFLATDIVLSTLLTHKAAHQVKQCNSESKIANLETQLHARRNFESNQM